MVKDKFHNNKGKYCGIVPPIITPLLEDESLDEQAYTKLINYCIDNGVHGIFAMGSSGEVMNVTRKVWQKAVEVALQTAAGRVPVFIGAIDSCTKRVIENIKELEQLGAQIVVATPAFYQQNSCQSEIIRHFEQICRSTNLEVVVYNIPPMTHVNILPETILEIAKFDNVVAYKDSCANWEQFQRNLFLLEDTNLSIFNGAEELCAASLIFGAEGCVPGLATFFPKLFIDLYNAALAQDVRQVYELQKQVWDLRKVLFVGKSWMSAMKYIAQKMNLGSDKVSSPIEPLTAAERSRIDEIIKNYKSR
jgi:4-hydroxy-tetrahydrodipicolinate synthase